MQKTDTRVQYTKARFADAMLHLLEQQPIGTVSVKALCEQAGLNRGTFYLHYSEPMDVLHEMEWALYERVVIDLGSFGSGGIESRFREQLAALNKERRLCAAVIGRNGDPLFMHRIGDRVYEALHEKLQSAHPERSEAEIRALLSFLFAGCTGVIAAWLGGNGLSDEETANLLAHLCGSVMQ